MSRGSLQSLVQQEEASLTTRDLLAMARHAASGMRYLEQKKVLHRDVALRNLLVSDYGPDGKYFVKVCRIAFPILNSIGWRLWHGKNY
jgi:hypothetical protein